MRESLDPVAPDQSKDLSHTVRRSDLENQAQINPTWNASENDARPDAEEERLQRLGTQRPEKFKNAWAEVGFVFAVVMSQILTEYFVSGFTVIVPTLIVELNMSQAMTVWPTGAFSVVVASTLLFFGRLSDMFGGRIVYICGIAWFAIWSLVAGFSQNFAMLVVCRALQGLGAGAFLPSSLMLLGSVYRPGPRKNTVFGLYAAAAPLGFYIGIFFAGLSGQFTTWSWYFWIGSILGGLTAVTALLSLPPDFHERKDMGVKMDWLGSVVILCGSVLVVYAVIDSSRASDGWTTPYIYVSLIIGVLILCIAVYVEGWIAEAPLIPGDIFHVKYMKPLFLSLIFFYGVLGMMILYFTLYMQSILGATPLQLVAWWSPNAVGGIILAIVGGYIMHLVPGTVLALIAGVSWTVSPLLFALAPGPGTNYWAFVFPAMICSTVGIDVMFNVTNVFITTSMPLRRQGLAGSLINVILQGSIALFLGLADLIAVKTGGESPSTSQPQDGKEPALLQPYRNVMWFAVACAGTSLVIMIGFVRIDKAESRMTADEVEASGSGNI